MELRYKDLVGLKFNRLTVISKELPNKHRKRMWLCKCDCGNITTVVSQALVSNHTKSCGCLNWELQKNKNRYKGITHGMSGENPEYRAWASIKERCYNKDCKPYKWYGGRGIKMYDKWVYDFKAFYDYVGNRPSPKHSIDRYPNNDGNYEPNNIRWATQKQQCATRRTTINITYNHTTLNLSDWAKFFNVCRTSIGSHIKRNGIEKSFQFYINKTNAIIP